MLVGPFDPAKADRDRPGRKQSTLTRTSNFDFFRKRAADDAIGATASATFKFGERIISIRRSLRDLTLIGYTLDGHEKLAAVDPIATDLELMDILAMLMGFDVSGAKQREATSYGYDYDFIVRNLIFFLEDKVPLIWNPDGQFVILRILLVKEELSEAIATARNELLRADSLYRNRLWSANKMRDDIQLRLEALPEPPSEVEEFGLAVSAVAGLQQSHDDLHQQRTYFSSRMDELENRLLRARAEDFEAQVRLRREEATYFQQAFRKVRSPGDLILQALQSHEGCLVCGNADEAIYERARLLMEDHKCPVCESDTSVPDAVADMGDAVLEKLQDAERGAALARQLVTDLERSSNEVAEQYRKTNRDLLGVTTDLDRARRREDALASTAHQSQLILELRARLDEIDTEVGGLKADLDAHVERHAELVKQSQTYVQERSNAIIEAFGIYASAFMVEDCALRYRSDRKAKVAQSDEQIDWPAFEVDLASGADAQPSERRGAAEVSESQKEFIDLAFRMALLKVASEGRPSMLVVETPEASLDAFFVRKAGQLLRDYAQAHGDNMLLASSNLTREEMIAQLLGTSDGLEDEATRRKRTLNLLDKARATKAYRQNKAFYDARFEEAVRGPAPAQPGSGDQD